MRKGISASPGIAFGTCLLLREGVVVHRNPIEEKEVKRELLKFELSVINSKNQIEELLAGAEKTFDEESVAIFKTHLLLLDDPLFLAEIVNDIQEKKVNIEFVVKSVVDKFIMIFESMNDHYMRDRAIDIRDIGERILRNLLDEKEFDGKINKDEKYILVGKRMTPSQLLLLDRNQIMGICTDYGGETSHVVLLARTLEIPMVVGLGSFSNNVKNGDQIVIDGTHGLVGLNLPEVEINIYKQLHHSYSVFKKDLAPFIKKEPITKDGEKVILGANISSLADMKVCKNYGIQHIGLFRTEFTYMDRSDFPNEEELFEIYKGILEKAGSEEVIIRTLDIGGDKFLEYYDFPKESNPFLGWRAIRFCLENLKIFKTQIRAILRASVYGNLSVIFPMITSLQEFRKAVSIFNEVKEELTVKKIVFSNKIQVGALIEVPAAVMIASELAREADFISIGTNDLIQFTIAVDRGNPKISDLFDPFHPAVFRMIQEVVKVCKKEGKPFGICGEMASNVAAVVVFVGMGVRKLSLVASMTPLIKKVLNSLDTLQAKRISNKILKMGSADEIKSCLKDFFKKNFDFNVDDFIQ